jgi:hypothetical protein
MMKLIFFTKDELKLKKQGIGFRYYSCSRIECNQSWNVLRIKWRCFVDTFDYFFRQSLEGTCPDAMSKPARVPLRCVTKIRTGIEQQLNIVQSYFGGLQYSNLTKLHRIFGKLLFCWSLKTLIQGGKRGHGRGSIKFKLLFRVYFNSFLKVAVA